MNTPRTGLLVSVRSAQEAAAALLGGADLIDVKEPARGALGRADDPVLAAVMSEVAGRRPVSAALGELRAAAMCKVTGLAYAKWGLAGAAGLDWESRLEAVLAERRSVDPACRPVAVAYADYQRAEAPPPAAVLEFAARHGAVLLIDTCVKDGRTLLDWLPLEEITPLRTRARQQHVPLALAGALGVAEIAALAHLEPDWFAVRGAACRAGLRAQAIDVERVRQLAILVHATCAS
jgi:uncharacterized protein (UPF0264 family)